MYVISKFHDYYDTAATYGIDKTVVYKRETSTVESKGRNVNQTQEFESKVGKVFISEFLVGFCGKIHPGLRIAYGEEVICVYNTEHFLLEAQDLGLTVNLKAKYSSWSSIGGWRGAINVGYVRHYFGNGYATFLPKFAEFHAPIFTVTRDHFKEVITVNDQIKKYQFFKIEGAATAFQSIYMFLSGVLGAPKNPPEEPSDKIKATNHGHDGEFSFKRPPGGKRWR